MKPTQRKFWNEYYRNHGSAWRKTNYFEEDFRGKSVLELGCGNGKSLAGILEKKPSRLVGIDLSEIAILVVKQRFPEKVELLRGECQDLPFKNEEFDYVVANHVVGAMKQKERNESIKEIYRVLKKGGKLIFSDFAVGDLRQKGEMIETNTFQKKNGIIQHFFLEKEVKNMLNDFSESKVETKSNYLVLNKEKVLRSEIFAKATK